MYRLFRRSLVVVALLLAMVSTGSAQTSGSHWPFEEVSGTTVFDAMGSNHGTLLNGVARLSSGRIGKALGFDGVNDYGTVGDSSSLEAAAFSVAVWVRRNDAQGDWAKILTKGNGTSAPWASYKFEFNGASDTIVNWHVGFTDGTAASVPNLTPLGNGQWMHLVGSYDGTALRLYVNGVLQGTTVVGNKAVRFDAVPLTLGGYAGWGYFRGDLDEARYFNYALSANEVQSVFSGASGTAQVTVSSPNTSTSWLIGSGQTIAWSHNLLASSTSKVEITRDGGSTWTLLAGSVLNGTQTGTYPWTVTGPATSQARVRVTATDGSATDVSDVAFSVSTPTIAVTSPNLALEVWTVGQAATVTWTSNLGSQETVKIELSTNGGSSYPIVIAASTPSDGTEAITVPSGWATAAGRVRISWLKDASRFDTSDADFSIQIPAQTSGSHWPFEEVSGTTVFDAMGSNHGTLLNGVARLSSGRIGKALGFDGVNDYGTVGDSSSLEAAAFSVAVWVRRNDAQGDWAKILTKGNGTSAPWASYKFEFNGASDTIVNWHVGFTDGTAASVPNLTPLGNGQWMHLVGSYDGTALRLYVNGVLQGTTVVGNKAVRFDAVPLTLGGYAGWGYFRGDLDEARYFNYALSANEVQSVFSGASGTAQVTVSSPNTSTSWLIGSGQTIAWSHNLLASSTSKVEITRDGGSTWTLLAGSVLNGTQTGTYPWTVTGPATSQARVRVTATDGSATDVSDVAFSVSTPTIAVTSPNLALEVWTVGQAATVTWTSNLGSQETVKIELSTNGGSSYPIVIAASTPSDGTEAITVPSGWATAAGRVRISWLKDASRFDTSDADFSIQTPALTYVSFQPTSAAFPNPERGFLTWTDFGYTDYNHVRAQGNTLTRPYFRLDSYRNSPLPQSFLNQLTAEFQKARQAGIKIIPRFWYNFGPYPNPDPDASRQRIESHLQQLAPILAANVDVISSMEAGFIGAWGEWHTSTNGLDTDLSAKAGILSALLAALPASRMVALRYPSDMQQLNGPPITPFEAFTATNRARVGSHQDCFLASDDDWGTWGRSGNSYAYDKAYVANNGQYAVVGGEACNPNPPRSECSTALSELAYLHFSYLNGDYEPNVLQGFVNGGCFDEIDRRLGYRFTLLSGSYSGTVQRGQTFQLNLQLANEGFAAMFNARPVFAVLYKGAEAYACQVNSDPRTWSAGGVTTISQSCVLPVNMTPGTYSWALWLPDEAPSIRNNPLYAVRFANQAVWDAARGYNVIANVTITP